MEITGSSAVVTGGASGLGEATAKLLAAKGMKVVVMDLGHQQEKGDALAKEIGADTRPASQWLPALVDTLRAHGIYPIARIVVFKDRVLAEKKPELAIRNTSGAMWRASIDSSPHSSVNRPSRNSTSS